MARSALAQKIYRLHLAFVREMNDMHIFVRQAIPLLEEATTGYGESSHRKDRRYYVPAIGRTKFARRKDRELKAIYDRYIDHVLYETFVVQAVSRCESNLTRVLRLILTKYPHKLNVSTSDISGSRSVPVNIILDADTLEDAKNSIIDRQLISVFYGAPKAYLAYFTKIAAVDTNDSAFANYVELKACRDLLIHNAGVVNEIYRSKVGDLARAELGDRISVDSDYFDDCLAILKRISGIIERDTTKAFPPKRRKGTT